MNPITFIQTARLYVRPWQPADHAAIHQVMANPLVHAQTGEDPWTLEETQDLIDWCTAQRWGWQPGYFNCPLLLRETDQLIGRVGLNPFRREERIPEIEWTLAPEHWGRGYASEVGRAMVRYGFEQCGFPGIIGFARPEHLVSQRLMLSIGMRDVGEHDHEGQTFRFYRVDRALLPHDRP